MPDPASMQSALAFLANLDPDRRCPAHSEWASAVAQGLMDPTPPAPVSPNPGQPGQDG